MRLTPEEKGMLAGKEGRAVQKSMEILVALGEIFGAERLIPVKSVQVAGVSYHNLGDAGLEYLEELARDGKVRVKTTLNPAGMDLKDWKRFGISREFAEKQLKVIDAFRRLGVEITATCTPYLAGNAPSQGDHIAWSESSAVCFANSVIGAMTNREGGPSALASAITGRTPVYGLHLEAERRPRIAVDVRANMQGLDDFSALGYVIGKKAGNQIPYIKGMTDATTDKLKIFSASLATYGGTAMLYMENVTPGKARMPKKSFVVSAGDIEHAKSSLDDGCEADFVAIGCPHASPEELKEIAAMLRGKKVLVDTWVSTSRHAKKIAEETGYIKDIESSGAKVAADTCMAVAPLKGRFNCMATNSAKACFYGRGSNGFKTRLMSTEECIRIALGKKKNR